MTVCIAAICEYQGQRMIVGASDRMITAGDIQFEPPQTKVFSFQGDYSHVIAMVAGDTAAQVEICRDTQDELRKRTVTEVGETARIYSRHFAAYRHRKAAQSILAPLNLESESFLKRQREMSRDFVERLMNDLQNYELDDQAIITGVDASGAHIYVVRDPGHAACNDDVGFAAVGIGEWHAESQFMFREYTKVTSWERALYLVYSAKKRAEVAPGVGSRATDMFIIGPGVGYYAKVPSAIMQELGVTYEDTITGQRTEEEKAYGKIERFIGEWVKQSQTAQGATTTTTTTDQGGVSGDAEAGQREDKEEA